MNYALAILGVLPIVLVGDLAFKVIASKLDLHYSFGIRVALAWALGTGLLTLAVFYASLINSGKAFLTTVIVFVSLAAVRMVVFFVQQPRISRLRLPRYRTLLPFLLLGILIGVVWSVSARAGLGLDGTAHWGIKAKDSFIHGGWRLFTPTYRSFSLPDYPLLIPTLQGWIYTFIGAVDEEAVKIIFIYFYAALALFSYAAIRSKVRLLLATIFTLLMVSTPLISISGLMAYADVPLMLYLLGSVFFLYRWLNSNEQVDIVIGSLLAAFSLLVKRDGIVHWVAALGIITILSLVPKRSSWSSSRIKQLLIYPAFGLLISGSWYLFIILGDIRITSFDSPTLLTLVERTSRIPTIIGTYLKHLSDPLEWGLLWFIFAIVTVWQRHKLKNKSILFVWLMTLLPLLFTATGILLSSDAVYGSHVSTAVDRLIMHTVPTAWFYVALSTTELDVWLQSMIAQRNDSVKGWVDQ